MDTRNDSTFNQISTVEKLLDREKFQYERYTQQSRGPISRYLTVDPMIKRQRSVAERTRLEKLARKAEQNREYRARKKQKEDAENMNPPEAAV
jgi:hypothetical protein